MAKQFSARLASLEKHLASDDGPEACEIPSEIVSQLAAWPERLVRPTSCGSFVIGRTWQAADHCTAEVVTRVQRECRELGDRVASGEIADYDEFLDVFPAEAFDGWWHAQEIDWLQTETLVATNYGRCGLIGIVRRFRGQATALHVWPGSIAGWQAAAPHRDRISRLVDEACPVGTEIKITFQPPCELPRHYDRECGEFLLARVSLPNGDDLGSVVCAALAETDRAIESGVTRVVRDWTAS